MSACHPWSLRHFSSYTNRETKAQKNKFSYRKSSWTKGLCLQDKAALAALGLESWMAHSYFCLAYTMFINWLVRNSLKSDLTLKSRFGTPPLKKNSTSTTIRQMANSTKTVEHKWGPNTLWVPGCRKYVLPYCVLNFQHKECVSTETNVWGQYQGSYRNCGT